MLHTPGIEKFPIPEIITYIPNAEEILEFVLRDVYGYSFFGLLVIIGTIRAIGLKVDIGLFVDSLLELQDNGTLVYKAYSYIIHDRFDSRGILLKLLYTDANNGIE